ncbi:imelysin family protein [Loktanella agnita]|uniref:imelysin family protein n=1 Tax=Loktanella agnita TaxID=287097 RepID=UPI003987D4BC
MKKLVTTLAFIIALPVISRAQTADIVENHILPRFAELAETSAALTTAADADCAPESQDLQDAYLTAFDAWIAASHLRFGPTEIDDRAYALAFWPDSRGVTPRSLATLIRDQDAIAESADNYADMSIAARGFYAMEFMLYDETIREMGAANYRCKLTQTIAADIAQITAAIYADWQRDYATQITNPSTSGAYRTEAEALQEMFKALTTGLQFTSDTRLGRPLGTFDTPRPTRAETWRSGRSARNVAISLKSLQDLADRLSNADPDIHASFDRALERLDALNDPIFAGVAAPQSRIRVEAVQQLIDGIRNTVALDLGPQLGVAAGFNSMDGD